MVVRQLQVLAYLLMSMRPTSPRQTRSRPTSACRTVSTLAMDLMRAIANAAQSAGVLVNGATTPAIHIAPLTVAQRHGLRFSSLQEAIAWNDNWRRDPLLPTLNQTDDANQVEANKEVWVRKVRDAIEHKGYLEAGDTWPVAPRSKVIYQTDEEDKDEWNRWHGQ